MAAYYYAVFGLLQLFLSYGEMQITLQPGVVQVVSLPANGSLILNVSTMMAGISYALCQAHTWTGKVTLSTQPVIHYSTAKSGRDVGIVSVGVDQPFTWYLFSNSTYNISVLLHAAFYTDTNPLVGGCNQEFNLEIDSNIALHLQATKTTVQFQWSNAGKGPNNSYPTCEDSTSQSYLEYHAYVKYMEADDFTENEYLDAISKMLTADDIDKYATSVHKISNTDGEKSYFHVSPYHHRGVVYAIVVKLNNKNLGLHSSAPYVPAVDYGCDVENPSACKQRDVAGVILATIAAGFGIFLCFFGHRFFKTENFVFGFLIFGLIFYHVLALETHISYVATIVLAAVFGLIGGCLLLGLWWYHGIPVINVLFIGLVTGYIITSVLYCTPLGNLSYLSTPFNYGATFACGVLLFPVLMLFCTSFLSILSCALTGSLGFVLALDMYMLSGFHTLFLNSIRHGTDRSYVKVLVTIPFTNDEIALTCVWLIVAAAGVGFQLFRERKKAPFPPCPRRQSQRVKDLRNYLRTRRSTPDREPLLRGDNNQSYGTSHHAQIQNEELESSEEEVNRAPRMV